MTATATFGREWSRALCIGCARLSALGAPVLPEGPLSIAALESGGSWDPEILQGRAKLVAASGPKDMRPVVSGHFGLRLSGGTGARGLFQVMPGRVRGTGGAPDTLALYAPSDPLVQLTDAIARWCRFAVDEHTGGFKTRAALYCLNLAPARLIGGEYDDDTIIYSANVNDTDLNRRAGRFTRTFWPSAYAENAAAFGRDPKDPEGRIRMRDLEVGLDRAVRATRERFDAELEAAYAANLGYP